MAAELAETEASWVAGVRRLRWIGELGAGATARVWAAADEAGQSFAVKIGLDAEQAERLAAEAESLAGVRCASLVRVHGGGRLPCAPPWQAEGPEGLPYLLLQKVEGVALGRLWSAGLSAAQAEAVAPLVLRQLAEALEELHVAGVAHGDVKPENILLKLTPAGGARATLIDLGLHAAAGASDVEGGTVRYLAPEVWTTEPAALRRTGDGRARDAFACALTLAELLVPALRDAADLRAAVDDATLPGPFELLLRPLLAGDPALRPSMKWLLARAHASFGWGEPWASARRSRVVRREYLRVRRDELERGSSARDLEVRVGGEAGIWLGESLTALRAARAIRDLAVETQGEVIHSAGRHQQRRWLVGTIGPSAARWPWQALPDERLCERLLALAERGPLEGIRRGQVVGASAATVSTDVPDDPTRLALRLAELPVDVRVLERIESLPEVHSELGIAAARAWRLRGEYARAYLLTQRLDVPTARLEGALAARRLGDVTTANRELESLEGQPADIESLAIAQRARQLLDRGELEAARALAEGRSPTAALLETRALIELSAGELQAASSYLEEARSLGGSEEQLARLEGVAGMLAHAEARPGASLEAFRRAASHAERAGAVLEEATYLTGVAAAATDRGEVGLALHAAERATLLFESCGRQAEAARAALARAAAYALLGAEAELEDAAREALWRAQAVGDRTCLGYAHLALCDGLGSRPDVAMRHAEQAYQLLASASGEAQLRAGARLLERGVAVEMESFDEQARCAASLEARLEWWGARARVASDGRRVGRLDPILEALLALAAERELGVARGPAFVQGARLALALGRSEDARRLLSGARTAARELIEGTPDELRRHAQALQWVALAETPEGSQFAPEQLEEIEALVRSLGGRERLKPLLEQVLDALLLWTGVERGLLLLRAPSAAQGRRSAPPAEDDVRLVVRAARNLAREDLRGEQLELSQSLARRALHKGAPVVAVDATGELSDVHRSVHALKLRSVLAVPLIARGETQGVVYLDDRVRRGAFGTSELAWVKLVATLAAVAIADARDQLRLRRAARRAERAEARMAADLARRELQLELAERQLDRARELRGEYAAIVGESDKLLALLGTVDRVAAADIPVLVLGESGSGKELIARALHENSARRARAFVAENCSAIPEPLLESTLFGHVRGAFTGAARQRAGLFEIAHEGTLFLDEIAEMPAAMQTKLLRVLQEGEIRPVGAERTRKVDVRVVAATHRDLREQVERGLFREDLYYRLNVVALNVPALRERTGDVPLLVRRFAEVHGQGRALEFEPEALSALLGYGWPGNVRQLENEVRRLLVLTEGVVQVGHLSPDIQAAVCLPRAPDTLHVRTRIDALECELVQAALERTSGNQTRAAELLGLSRFGLQKMMKRLQLARTPVGRRVSAGRKSPSGLQERR